MRRITSESDICHGKPTLEGTRIMVTQVLDLLASGRSEEEIVADYFPDLSVEDVRGCVRYAQSLVDNEEIHFIETTAA